MRDALALLTAGVGIFFLGLELVSTGSSGKHVPHAPRR